MRVETDAHSYYSYLTEREIELRKEQTPPQLSDVTALGSHYGEFDISEEELDTLVSETERVDKPAHHKVWIGQWELGMSWDRLLVYSKRVHSGVPRNAGTCYQDASNFLMKQDEGFLIHGSVQFSPEAPRVNHAWVELPTGWVWEPQTGQYFTIEDFRIMSPEEHHRYTDEQAAIMGVRTGNHGPWSDEEREQWLGR